LREKTWQFQGLATILEGSRGAAFFPFAQRQFNRNSRSNLLEVFPVHAANHWYAAKPWAARLASIALLFATPAVALAADDGVKNLGAPSKSNQTVEMFAAMQNGDIDVKIIPKDATEARVLIKNNTKQPLNVKLPDAFAGRPILAQRAGGGGGGNSTSGGGNQSMGGGMGGMGGGMMGGGGGGMGMFSVPPEQLGQFKVPTVCLEHGKKDPRPQIAYEIVPLDKFTKDPAVKELLTAFGKQKLDQRVTQAAAWHLANDMSWEELAGKRIEHLNGTSELWFSANEIQAGMHVASTAVATVDADKAKDLAQAPAEGVTITPVVEE